MLFTSKFWRYRMCSYQCTHLNCLAKVKVKVFICNWFKSWGWGWSYRNTFSVDLSFLSKSKSWLFFAHIIKVHDVFKFAVAPGIFCVVFVQLILFLLQPQSSCCNTSDKGLEEMLVYNFNIANLSRPMLSFSIFAFWGKQLINSPLCFILIAVHYLGALNREHTVFLSKLSIFISVVNFLGICNKL